MWIESRIALRFLRQGRTQTAMIVIGIAVGVAVIVFITAMVTGLQANLIERTLGTQAHIRVEPLEDTNRILPAPAGTVQLVLEDKRAQRLRSINNWPQVLDTLDRLPGIVAVSPVMSGPAMARRGDAFESVALMGVYPERYQKIIPIEKDMIAGQFRLSAGDAVIGRLLADDLGLRLGSKLRLEAGNDASTVVNVVGVFDLGVRELDSRYVFIDLKLAQSLLDLPGGVTLIDLGVADIFGADGISQRVASLTNLKAESWMQSNTQLMNALASQRLSTNMISTFVAISVAFGIASVLAISVTQRTREIGILRAVGTTREQMLHIFLLQGGVLGLAGSAVGSVAGLGLVAVFNNLGPGLFLIPLPPALIPIAMAAATLTGILAAAVPAWRASRLDPVVAIRYV